MRDECFEAKMWLNRYYYQTKKLDAAKRKLEALENKLGSGVARYENDGTERRTRTQQDRDTRTRSWTTRSRRTPSNSSNGNMMRSSGQRSRRSANSTTLITSSSLSTDIFTA